MALKKLPGGVIVETATGARLNEEAGVNLEAIHRQIVAGVDDRVGQAAAGVIEEAAAEADRASAEADRATTALTVIDDAGVVRGARIAESRGETAWAQATDDGHRLPLGYAPDGTLDAYARAAWLRDLDNARDGIDPEWARVRTTPDGRIIYGERWDGTVVIPGLERPPSSGGGGDSGNLVAPGLIMGAGGTVSAGTLLPDVTRLGLWGSSTAFYLAEAVDTLARGHGMTLYRGGKGGEQSSQVAARLGSDPARLTFPGGVLPASGAVEVTADPDQHLHETASALRPYTGHVVALDGSRVAGTLSGSGTTLTFTRQTAGTASPVYTGVPFIPDDGEAWARAVTIITAGKNDYASTTPAVANAERVVQNRLRMVEHQAATLRRVLILGDYVNIGMRSAWAALVREANARSAATFGPAFVDVAAWLASPQAWQDTGVSPTADDLTAQAKRELPPSLALDSAHLNPAGNTGLAKLIDRHMTGLGWL